MVFKLKKKNRDDRDFDTTSLHEAQGIRTLSRDYSAHFFRWSFARRLIKKTDHVLEVGCGPETPMAKLLVIGLEPKCESYTGVDLNKVKPSKIQRMNLIGEFNFVENWRQLLRWQSKGELPKFQVAVNMEVIEHMKVEHGREMLKGIHSLLAPGGLFIISTPCYDGRRHAANHIHEYTVPELKQVLERTGFTIENRFGTFMDIKKIGKGDRPADVEKSIDTARDLLSDYFDNDAISNIFGPLYPDHARNNLWLCRKKS